MILLITGLVRLLRSTQPVRNRLVQRSPMNMSVKQSNAMILASHLVGTMKISYVGPYSRDTGQYFKKASPVRPGDYLEFFAEIDLIIGLSACPGGNCADAHSSDLSLIHI